MRYLLMILALLFAAGTAGAQTAATGDIHVAAAKARPAGPGAAAAAVYLVIMNHGAADDTLTGISTPVADKAEAHRTTDVNGIMKMEPVTGLVIKANDAVAFAPGGLHIMLTGLRRPLVLGQSFPLTLTFAKAGPVETTVTVAPVGPPKHDMPGMKM
jgi:copper(I)-binding protein